MHAATPLMVIHAQLTPAEVPKDECTKLFATALFSVVRLKMPSDVHRKGSDE